VGVSVEVEGGGYGAEQKMKKESVLVFVGGGWRCERRWRKSNFTKIEKMQTDPNFECSLRHKAITPVDYLTFPASNPP
jgi:hypothetical protein